MIGGKVEDWGWRSLTGEHVVGRLFRPLILVQDQAMPALTEAPRKAWYGTDPIDVKTVIRTGAARYGSSSDGPGAVCSAWGIWTVLSRTSLTA